MSNGNIVEFQTSHEGTVPGFWKLEPGRVLSLQPRRAGLLRVAQGQVWVTMDVPHLGAGNELGDHFLHAGEQLAVGPGQHLVLEPFARAGQLPVFFEWTSVPQGMRTRSEQNASPVTQPLRDLGLALVMVGTALAHLCAGVVVFGRQLVSGRVVEVQPQRCS